MLELNRSSPIDSSHSDWCLVHWPCWLLTCMSEEDVDYYTFQQARSQLIDVDKVESASFSRPDPA
jgi:hypothetical protein